MTVTYWEVGRRIVECEALRGGWSVRQMDRHISTLFYERTLASTRYEKPFSPSPRFGSLFHTYPVNGF